MLDTTRSVETPEGVELHYRIAGPVVRTVAWIIDVMIRGIIYIFAGFMFSFLFADLGVGLFFLSIFILEWFYPVLFEVYRDGATPGKRAMKIKVLHDTGAPVGWTGAMIRNLLRAVDILPAFYGFGLITMLLNKNFQRLGDLTAGTVVVYQDEFLNTAKKNEQKTADFMSYSVEPLLLPALTLAEQQAIVNFAERAQTLSSQRATELADIVTSLTHKTGEESKQHLYQIASNLMGHSIETTPL